MDWLALFKLREQTLRSFLRLGYSSWVSLLCTSFYISISLSASLLPRLLATSACVFAIDTKIAVEKGKSIKVTTTSLDRCKRTWVRNSWGRARVQFGHRVLDSERRKKKGGGVKLFHLLWQPQNVNWLCIWKLDNGNWPVGCASAVLCERGSARQVRTAGACRGESGRGRVGSGRRWSNLPWNGCQCNR